MDSLETAIGVISTRMVISTAMTSRRSWGGLRARRIVSKHVNRKGLYGAQVARCVEGGVSRGSYRRRGPVERERGLARIAALAGWYTITARRRPCCAYGGIGRHSANHWRMIL